MSAMEARKRAKQAWVQLSVLLLVLVGMESCKWGIPNYTLTVVVEEGVTGTPQAGKYLYKDAAPNTVDFSYSGVNSLHTVEVLLNGGVIRQSGSGSIILYADGYELRARLVDIRGTWTFDLTYTDTSLAGVSCTITISGDNLLSGTFTDSRGFSGNWTGESNTLTLVYSDWNGYVLTGTVYDMAGTFNSADTQVGTWSATRTK